MAIIKQILIDGVTYDISAMSIQDGSGNAKSWQDILDKIEAGFDLVYLSTLPTADASAYENYHNCLVLTPNSGSGTNIKNEYIITRSGTDPNYTYAWELIGTTEVDLSNYVQCGTYTTSTPSSDATGSAGAQEITTSEAGSQTASGSATVTYVKADTVTGSAGAIDTNTGNAGGATINGSNFNFNGTAASLTPSVKIDKHIISAHSHTVNLSSSEKTVVTGVKSTGGTVSVVTGVNAVSLDGDVEFNTDAIKSATIKTGTGYASEFNTDAIKSATLTSGTTATTGYMQYVESVGANSLSGNTGLVKSVSTTGSKTVITSVTYQTTSVMQNASVDANGVLSFGTTTVATSASGTTSTLPTGITTTTGDVSITNGTVTKKYATITTNAATKASVGITTAAASKGTVSITGGGASGTTDVILSTGLATTTINNITGATLNTNGATTLVHTQTATTVTYYNTLNGNTIDYTPAGTIGGSQTIAAHSHSVSVASHTHSIATATASATGTAAVAVSSHTHSVSVASHTHTLSNHTHNITFTPTA